MSRYLLILPLLIGAIVAQACTSPSGLVCTAEYRFGLAITVIDSVTSSPPTAATLIARSGTFVDSVGPTAPYSIHVNDSPVLILNSAGERAGTYDVTVRSPGYRDWTRSGINVSADECHVRLTSVTARLQR
jgi:hypothetical protein